VYRSLLYLLHARCVRQGLPGADKPAWHDPKQYVGVFMLGWLIAP
jgi:hypothetical protein